MDERSFHQAATFAEIGLAAVTFAALFFITAPYGRHERRGFGPAIPQRLAWILMEAPAALGWAAIYAAGAHRAELVPLVLLGLWQMHYLQRTFIFPFRIRAGSKTTPAVIVASAIVFNTLNAYVNARWVSHFGSYDTSWLRSPQFIVGAAMMVTGFVLNIQADNVLIRLRASRGEGAADQGYQVPRGGLYRWVSCPNYLAEILEWTGWAVLTWSWAGLAFALYTTANLAPRARSHHAWYRERFPDYPRDRRALVPYLF